MEKRLVTADFSDLEEGGSVTYWVNPPSGRVRAIQKATARLRLDGLVSRAGKPSAEDIQAIMRQAEAALEADEEVWRAILGMVDSWALRGWGADVLPVSMEGLDELPGETRQAVLERLMDALSEVRKLDPRQGASSSSISPDESAPAGESATILDLATSRSQSHSSSFATG